MSKKQTVRLSATQRYKLRAIIKTGKRKAREVLHAHSLLKTAQGWTDAQIADAFDISPDTVRRTRLRYQQSGLNAAVNERPRAGQPPKLTLRQETRLVALACSSPPVGHQRWTVRLLTEEAIKRKMVRRIAPETARRVLKKSSQALADQELVYAQDHAGVPRPPERHLRACLEIR